MMNKKIGIIALALCFCLLPFGAHAASSANAMEPIVPDRTCSLTVSCCYGEMAFQDVEVKLYRIAEVSADSQYTLTQSFASSGLDLNGVQGSSQWNVIRTTLEAHILSCNVAPDAILKTDQHGQVHFDALSTGMYLAVIDQVTQDDWDCCFDSAMVSLPGLGQDGRWQYVVTVNAKAEMLPSVKPDGDLQLKALKLWKGDEGRTDRPASVEIEIFRDGNSYQRVVLSEENHWSYTWQIKDDGSRWSVVERNIPDGYMVTVEEREAAFVLTNTRTSTPPDAPVIPPKTGDSANIMLYVLLMTVSGAMLILLGVARKRTD